MTTSETLFGTHLRPVSPAELSRILGVSPRTISNWKRNPDTIPLGMFRRLAQVRRLSDEEIVESVRRRP